MQYKHELRTVSMSDQLTPETLMSRLQAQRVAPPLLLHHSLKEVSVSDNMRMVLKILFTHWTTSLDPHLSPHLVRF